MARRRTELVKADADTDLLPRVTEPRPDTAPGVGEIEVLERGEILQSPTGVLAERPEDILAEPPDARDISAELAAPPRRRLPWLTLLLSAGVVAAAAFSVGALVEKHHLQNSPTAGRGFSFPTAGATGGAGGGRTFGGFGGGTGTGPGTGSGTGAAGAVTVGTVKLVDGSTIYVTDAQGNIVKITTGKSTKVTESKQGKVSDLKAGQSVTVLGSKNADGDIAATTVTQGSGAPGGFGGFGGFGGGGTGRAGATGGTGN